VEILQQGQQLLLELEARLLYPALKALLAPLAPLVVLGPEALLGPLVALLALLVLLDLLVLLAPQAPLVLLDQVESQVMLRYLL